MDNIELFQRLGLAVAIGFLIGTERGWHTREQSGGLRVAGVRTFSLIGLLGGLWGLLSLIIGDVLLGFAFVSLTALVMLGHALALRKSEDFGITTQVAELVVFALGALAVRGDMVVAAAAAVITAGFLNVKPRLHHFVGNLRRLELAAALKLLLISVVMLPMLPDEGYGPGNVLNPYELWWLVVLVAGLSFVGYFAIRKTGTRVGTLLTGLFGGIASSTALTISFARLSKQSKGLSPMLAAGVAVAASVMFVRLFALAAILYWPLAVDLAVPLAIMAGVGLAGALAIVLHYHGRPPAETPDIEIDNPLELSTALKFAVFLGGVVLLSHYMQQWFGEYGLYALAGASGLADVDAIAVSVAQQAKGVLTVEVAARAVIIAAVANTLVKVIIVAIAANGSGMIGRVAGVCAACSATGIAAVFLLI